MLRVSHRMGKETAVGLGTRSTTDCLQPILSDLDIARRASRYLLAVCRHVSRSLSLSSITLTRLTACLLCLHNGPLLHGRCVPSRHVQRRSVHGLFLLRLHLSRPRRALRHEAGHAFALVLLFPLRWAVKSQHTVVPMAHDLAATTPRFFRAFTGHCVC